MGLFILVGLLSIYPTICYLRWNPQLKLDIAPELSTQAMQKLRKIIHTELVGILGVLLCASLMEKGLARVAEASVGTKRLQQCILGFEKMAKEIRRLSLVEVIAPSVNLAKGF